jgi:hypothetical protein
MAKSTARKVSRRNEPTPIALAGAGIARLVTVRVIRVEEAARQAVVDVGGREITAELEPSVHPEVIAGAAARGERVLAEVAGDRAVVLGALRTQPTPGIDRAARYAIEAAEVAIVAERVSIDGDEVALSSKTARIVLRAASEIESFAERIVSRASGVHKIVGRMLRLN